MPLRHLKQELEKRKVMRDVHLSELSERRKSMVPC